MTVHGVRCYFFTIKRLADLIFLVFMPYLLQVLKATGFRMIMILGGLYAGLYAYERLAWTNRARETLFKSQYVDYASHKLRLIVDLTGTNARHQVGALLPFSKLPLLLQKC